MRVDVRRDLGRLFRTGYENRLAVEYYAKRLRDSEHEESEAFIGDASYKALRGLGGRAVPRDDLKRRSAGYLVHLPLGEGMPRLLAAFGLSGTMTLLFCHWLGRSERRGIFDQVLRHPKDGYFLMAEITTCEPIPSTPPTLEACLEAMGAVIEVIAEGGI